MFMWFQQLVYITLGKTFNSLSSIISGLMLLQSSWHYPTSQNKSKTTYAYQRWSTSIEWTSHLRICSYRNKKTQLVLATKILYSTVERKVTPLASLCTRGNISCSTSAAPEEIEKPYVNRGTSVAEWDEGVRAMKEEVSRVHHPSGLGESITEVDSHLDCCWQSQTPPAFFLLSYIDF